MEEDLQKKQPAEILVAWRKKKGFTQAQAALALQISTKTFWNWENGKTAPPNYLLDILM